MSNGGSATGSSTGSAGASAVASSTGEGKYSQVQVEAMVQERLNRERKRLQAQIDELKAGMHTKEQREEYERLKKEVEERKTADVKTAEDAKKLVREQQVKHEEQLKEEREAAEKKTTELKDQLIRHNIDSKLRQLAAAKGVLAEKVEQVILLLKTPAATGFKLSLNDKGEIEFEPVGGGNALSKDGGLLNPEIYVAEFLEKNKHFLRADIRDGGAGMSDTNTTSTTGKGKLNAFQIKAAKAAGVEVEKVEEHQQDHIKP